MNYIQYIVLFNLLFWASLSNAQKTVSLQEAMDLAIQNYPKLKQQELYVQQQKSLRNASKGHPMMSLGYSWDELNFSANQGVHSIYAQQAFNLPEVAKAKQALQDQKAKSGELQKELTKQQLLSQVAITYQQILYTKSKGAIHNQLLAIYKEFERIAQRKIDVGETGLLPLLAVQTTISQLEAEITKTRRELPIQLTQLQHWLLDESINNISDTGLVLLVLDTTGNTIDQHPSVQVLQQNIQIQEAQKKVIRSRLTPQISTGLRLQVVDGQFPYFGGQLGINVPLFNKGINTQLKAADLGIQIQKEQVVWQEKELSHHRHQLQLQIEQRLEQIKLLEENILPKLQQQIALSQKAYRLGEIEYQHYLQHTKDLASIQYDYLEQLLILNIQILNYQYLVE
ncbi:MAG: TolC family protein [Aureispira sp.]|nr:TolC family protein [Aureispira sp.]